VGSSIIASSLAILRALKVPRRADRVALTGAIFTGGDERRIESGFHARRVGYLRVSLIVLLGNMAARSSIFCSRLARHKPSPVAPT
jgi:hypothetical protein